MLTVFNRAPNLQQGSGAYSIRGIFIQNLVLGDFMLYLGVDIGKNTHVASLMDESSKVIFKGFSFSNTTDGGESLLTKLSVYPVTEVEIGLEATGHYWLATYSFLIQKGYIVHVINPILTDGWRKGTEIRKRKTDTIDSILIADLIRYGDFVETHLTDETMLSLRNLCRFRSYLVDSVADLKRKVICVLDQVFPEYQLVFKKVFGATSKELLLQFTNPMELETLSVESLAALLARLSRQKIGYDKAEKLSSFAGRSFGVTFGRESFTFQLKAMLEQMKFIEVQIADTEKEIKTLLANTGSFITTITGIGFVTGATILSEIGDISKFDSPNKLVAFAGIDASVRQSGEFEGNQNKMSKRGSPYLRRALFQAALIAEFNDPELSAFHCFFPVIT